MLRQCIDHFIVHMSEYVYFRRIFFVESKKMFLINNLITKKKKVRFLYVVHLLLKKCIIIYYSQTTDVDLSVIPRKFLLSWFISSIFKYVVDALPTLNTLILSDLLARNPLQISQTFVLVSWNKNTLESGKTYAFPRKKSKIFNAIIDKFVLFVIGLRSNSIQSFCVLNSLSLEI